MSRMSVLYTQHFACSHWTQSVKAILYIATADSLGFLCDCRNSNDFLISKIHGYLKWNFKNVVWAIADLWKWKGRIEYSQLKYMQYWWPTTLVAQVKQSVLYVCVCVPENNFWSKLGLPFTYAGSNFTKSRSRPSKVKVIGQWHGHKTKIFFSQLWMHVVAWCMFPLFVELFVLKLSVGCHLK